MKNVQPKRDVIIARLKGKNLETTGRHRRNERQPGLYRRQAHRRRGLQLSVCQRSHRRDHAHRRDAGHFRPTKPSPAPSTSAIPFTPSLTPRRTLRDPERRLSRPRKPVAQGQALSRFRFRSSSAVFLHGSSIRSRRFSRAWLLSGQVRRRSQSPKIRRSRT